MARKLIPDNLWHKIALNPSKNIWIHNQDKFRIYFTDTHNTFISDLLVAATMLAINDSNPSLLTSTLKSLKA